MWDKKSTGSGGAWKLSVNIKNGVSFFITSYNTQDKNTQYFSKLKFQ